MTTDSPEFSAPVLPTTAPQPRARPIPRKIKDAIEAMLSGKARNLTQAAKVAGISREYLSRTLTNRPDVVEYAKNRAARVLGIGASVAAAKMMELIHSSSQRVGFEASRHVLALSGIKPPPDTSMNVNIELKAGYVIDLSGRIRAGPKIVAGQVVDAQPEPIAGIGPDHGPGAAVDNE
jgi:hypothetical protein